MKATEFAVRHSTTVLLLALMIVVFGLQSYFKLPREAAPDIVIPYIIVTTPYFGVSPEDMESLVTNKIETELKNIRDIDELTSTSAESLSMVAIKFKPDVDIDNALQLVRERVNVALPELPKDVETPIIREIAISDFPIIMINLVADYGLVKLRNLAEEVQEELENVPGTLEVRLTGGLEREIQVDIDPERLAYYKLSISDVTNAVNMENINLPGGDIQVGAQKFLIRVPGEFKNALEIRDAAVKKIGDQVVRIKDIGDVRDHFKERDTLSRIDGVQSVSIAVSKRSGENIIKVSDAIKTKIDGLKKDFPAGTKVLILNDTSKYIREMVLALENNIITGLILVMLSLFIFMGLRNSFFVAIAIPFSLLVTFIVLRALDINLNMIVLFSLILALGMLVDNAIVIVENIYRHAQQGKTMVEATLDAVKEVAWPVITSTATTVAVFMPLLFWPGITGQFMEFLPQTIIITLIASLFVALIINPTICSRFLTVSKGAKVSPDGIPDWRILGYYQKTLEWALRNRIATLVIAFAALFGSFLLYSTVHSGIAFFPKSTPESARINVRGAEGTALEFTDSLVKRIEEGLNGMKNIRHYVSNVGSGGGGGSSNATHRAYISIEFPDYEDLEEPPYETMEKIREVYKEFAGATIDIQIQEMGPPKGAAIQIEVAGKDFTVLGELANQVRQAVKEIEGVVDLKDNYEASRSEVKVHIDREAAKKAGTSTFAIAQSIRTAFHGSKAGNFRVGKDEFDITVRLKKENRSGLDDLLDLTVAGKDGVPVPLKELANIEISGGLGAIQHKERKRVVTITANAEGRTPATIMKEARERLRDFKLPPGYFIEFSGETEDMKETQEFLSDAFLAGVFLIFLILVTQFDSIAIPFIIMLSIVLSFIGVMLSLFIHPEPLSIVMTGMGVISLAGVVVNNAIVLIDFIRQLCANCTSEEKTSAIVKAGIIRFRPVILTALTTIVGLLPMAVGVAFDFINWEWQLGGRSVEWWRQMARIVIYGLMVSTVLTLVVVPVAYSFTTTKFDLWSKLWKRKKTKKQTEEPSPFSSPAS